MEFLFTVINDDRLNGDSQPKGIVYRTYAQENAFKCRDWGSYYSIAFLGEKYFSGYIGRRYVLSSSSEDRNLMETGQISMVLIDSDKENLINRGSSIALKQGYELRINEIDSDGRKVRLSLYKNGMEVDPDNVVVIGKKELSSYLYKINIGSANKIVTLAAHFKNAYSSIESNMVTIDGIWQISDSAIKIDSGTKIGKMTIENMDYREGEMSIEMDNGNHLITLSKNKDEPIMTNFYIRTADQDEITTSNPLRFYIYKAATIPTLLPPINTTIVPPAKILPPAPINDLTPPAKMPGFEAILVIAGLMAGALDKLRKKK